MSTSVGMGGVRWPGTRVRSYGALHSFSSVPAAPFRISLMAWVNAIRTLARIAEDGRLMSVFGGDVRWQNLEGQ